MRQAHRARILVLAPRNPYPVIGGDRLRIHRLARELARFHDLTLLTLCESKEECDAPLPDDGVFRHVHRVLLPRWRSCLSVLAALPTAEPLQVAYYRSGAFRTAVQALAPGHDVVLAHLVRTADYARELPMVRVLEMTDAISMSMQRVARTKLGYFDFRRLIYAIEARRLAAYERRMADEFDLVSLNSPVDHSFLFESGSGESREPKPEHVMIVPNGVDAPARMPPPLATRRRAEIVFVGNLYSLQNFDAAWFFARHVMPLVLAQRPDAEFRVIGPLRPGAAARLAALPGVRVEGVVPSLERALASARIGVCVARISSGMQNKLLDYFANRLAVVCSPAAFEALEAREGEHLLLARSAEEWASQVLRLIEDEMLAQRLADAGRNLVCQHYRWERCVEPLLLRIQSLLEQRYRVAA